MVHEEFTHRSTSSEGEASTPAELSSAAHRPVGVRRQCVIQIRDDSSDNKLPPCRRSHTRPQERTPSLELGSCASPRPSQNGPENICLNTRLVRERLREQTRKLTSSDPTRRVRSPLGSICWNGDPNVWSSMARHRREQCSRSI